MKLKKTYTSILIILTFLLGIAIMGYPFFSSWYNQMWQKQLITEYNDTVSDISSETKQSELAACYAYNQSLLQNVVLTDPFDRNADLAVSEAYSQRLNVQENGIMAHLEIPKIDVNLPIYHGTSEVVLDMGVGHLEKSSLPIGGTATHAVLSAHTAYAEAEMFNDLIELNEADVFYLTVLDDKLAYQVDQIKVVEPTDTSDLKIDRNEDYVTLVTCTPYGVNSHRLLVRGTRIPYTGEAAETVSKTDWLPFIVLFLILLLILSIVRWVVYRKNQTKKDRQ
ncbi:class C sortase [Eubacterium sp. 1001713B170207_170306_E7]|uniref:class C sortase n=1 Tax=Eubacterium sp. 1001713B170207_170306_E7 TaxID=2787097 RepID=UPI001FAE2C6E|nr:class C sortase [Eubacterium sp. 1001713B170207_170306_E7]